MMGNSGEPLEVRVARIEEQIGPLKAGVTNFRAFQQEGRDFFEEARAFQRELTIKHDAEIAYQEKLAADLKSREHKADRWWKRILTWLLIMGSLISAIETFRPVIQRWLHIPVAAADPPKSTSRNTAPATLAGSGKSY